MFARVGNAIWDQTNNVLLSRVLVRGGSIVKGSFSVDREVVRLHFRCTFRQYYPYWFSFEVAELVIYRDAETYTIKARLCDAWSSETSRELCASKL